MELGLLHDFFGNFSTGGERYYFGWRGAHEVRICMWGENVYSRWAWGEFEWWRGHMRWEYLHKVRMCTQGDFEWWRGHAKWEYVRKVRMCTQGDFEWWRGHVRWEYVHEVRMCMRGENMHPRWLWGVEGTTLQRPFLYSIDVTSMMTKLQMIKIPRVWPYVAQSHLTYLTWGHEVTLRLNCHMRSELRWKLPREVGDCHTRIATQDDNCHVIWELPHEVGMVTWDENCHVRWELPRKMRIATRDENYHVRWELPHEMRIGGNGHVRWELPHKMRIAMWDENCHVRWELPHEMRIAMQGGNGHARWELPHKMRIAMRDKNCHARWELPHEMRIATQGGNGHARYEPPSEILDSLIFFHSKQFCQIWQIWRI